MSGTMLHPMWPVLLLLLILDLVVGPSSTPTSTLSLCTGSSRYQCMQNCFNNGSRLITIKDLNTNDRTRNFLVSNNVTKAFIGMDDQAREGYFQRTDGTTYVPTNFNRWASASGTPVQLNEGDNCVTIDSTGNWRVESCTLVLPSVCETASNLVLPSTRWTSWCDSDKNSFDGDNENINFARAVCGDICNSPLGWKCRVFGSTTMIPSGVASVTVASVTQNLTIPCSKDGLVCDLSSNPIGCLNYEVSYLCPADIDECASNLHNCHLNARCINTPGSYVCECNAGYSGDGFNCKLGATCSAFASTHIVTFDGAHQFGGSRCDFLLSANSNATSGARYNYSVEIRQDLVGPKVFITSILVRVYNLTIILDSATGVTVNAVPLTPTSKTYSGTFGGANISVSLHYLWNDVSVTTDYGLHVSYDFRRYLVTLFVPNIPQIRPTGLCGNADGHQANDLTPKGASTVSTDRAAIYGSWMTATQTNNNCSKTDIAIPLESNSVAKASISVICNAIIANYAFSTYFSDPTLLAVFNDACHTFVVAPFDNRQLCLLTTSIYRLLSSRGLIDSTQLFPPGLCQDTVICRANEVLVVAARPCDPAASNCAVRTGPECSIQRRLPTCRCRTGFLRSGDACVPVGQCGCSPPLGYKSRGEIWYTNACTQKRVCNATNSIATSGNQCVAGTRCVQLPDGSSFCDCADGYAGPSCNDIDECAKGLHACHAQAVCNNTAGTYQCRCLTGYQGNGFNCTDVNECVANPNPCSANALCSNTLGSFLCACVSPYVGDGKACSIPFIAPNYADATREPGCSYYKEIQCHPRAICSDLANGSFACSCPHGFIGDGYKGSGRTGCSWPNCPTNYINIEGFCYYYDPTSRNHSSATNYCASLGGTPVTILRDLVKDEVKVLLNNRLVTSRFWTGYADSKTSDFFPPMDFVGSLWKPWWLTGPTNNKTSVTNPAVGSYRPDLCATGILSSGEIKLEAVTCSSSYATVCKVPGAVRSCPEGWQSLGSYCYYMSEDLLTYDDAMLKCSLLGSDLVSITNNNVSKFLFDYFFDSNSASGYHWIGLQYNTLISPGNFIWWDGAAYNPSYLMWANASEPAVGKNCAAISTQARWVGRNCTDKLGYICQKQRWVYYRCPQNAYYFKGKCYTVIAVTQNFNSHLDACRAIGGDLISFGTPQEYNFFDKVIYKGQSGPKTYYTGLFLAADATAFSSIDGSQSNFVIWVNGTIPSNGTSNRCTQIANPAAGFQSVNCSSQAWSVCEFVNTPCLQHSDCAANGECFLGQCRCRRGYHGDGQRSCVDIDECQIAGICQAFSTCQNSVGSYQCVCNTDYQMNAEGICRHFRYCVSNSGCFRLAACNANMCTCNRGYLGDGINSCVDINECATGTHNCNSVNATCTNTAGSFTCQCKNGFVGDGRFCRELPRTCHELRLKNSTTTFPFKSRQFIDPDGQGPLNALEVNCEMYADYGVTVFPPNTNKNFRWNSPATNWQSKTIYTSLVEEMKNVVDNSFFCIQSIIFYCYSGSNLMESIRYLDRNLTSRGDWGSGTEGQCLCGTVGLCRRKTASCNCNGDTQRYLATDYGYVINRGILPIRGFSGRATVGSAEYVVGELRCSGVTFDISANCDGIVDKTSSNVHLIDPDQRGSLPPFPALCFNPSCNKALINSATIVSHDNFGQRCSYGLSKSVVNGDNPITYCAPVGQLAVLKSQLAFCSQEIRYDCNNSPIVTVGNENSGFYTTGKTPLSNMGYGSPSNKTCPCAALNKCINRKACNCDNTGIGATYDFGWVNNKDQLPIMGLTAQNIGSASSGNVSVGYFACSSIQFGVMGTCQMYRTRFRDDDDATFIFRNYQDDYVYPIDPDLKGNATTPFPAYCDFLDYETGVTVIPNLAAGSSACSNTTALCATKAQYYHTYQQIAAIATRSTYCSQEVTYRCRQSPLLKGTNETTKWAYWKSYLTNATRYDFGRLHQTAVDGGIGCGCKESGVAACVANNLKCACDAASTTATSESILLDDKTVLPVDSMFVAGVENYVEFGDMRCYDISDSCHNRYNTGYRVDIEETCVYQRLGDFYLLPNQYKGGFNPLGVRCNPGGETRVQIANICGDTSNANVNATSRERCYNVDYYYGGAFLNMEQVSFLVKQSTYCLQFARFTSRQSRFTDHIRWTSLFGGEFTHWGGTQGRPGCACGIMGICNRTGDACNTDNPGSSFREDRGYFVNFRGTGDLIPVTQVCIKVNSHQSAHVQTCFDSVRCMESTDYRIAKDCQDFRDKRWNTEYLHALPPNLPQKWLEPWVINQFGSTEPPVLAACEYTNSPPIGVTIIGAKTCGTFTSVGGLLNLTYHGFPRHQLDALVNSSTYCTQRVEFKCRSAAFSVSATQGASDKNGTRLPYWGGESGSGCNGGACQCDGVGTAWKNDDAVFTDKNVLPLSSIALNAVAANSSERQVCVYELRCHKIYPDCNTYYRGLGDPPYPNGRNELAVDPDQAGPLTPFSIACDIYECPNTQNQKVIVGVTRFYFSGFSGDQSYTVNAATSNATTISFSYVSPNAAQVAALADISGQCWQLLHAYSQKTGLLGAGVRIFDRSGAMVNYFSGSDVALVTGCACRVLGTCANDSLCHSDEGVVSAQSGQVSEGTYVMNKRVLPLTGVTLPPRPSPTATLQVYVEPLRCAPNYCALPLHCSHVGNQGRKTSFEQWIMPGGSPFLVLCVVRGNDWVTQVIVDTVTRNATGYTTVTYKTATPAQLTELVQSLSSCTQAVKVTCSGYRLMANPGFALISAAGQRSRNFVSGLEQCACGDRDSCQGTNRAQIDARACNCDIGDNETRVDSGVLSGNIPIVGIDTSGADASGSALWQISAFFCSKNRYNLNECLLGLHDCDKNADCNDADAASITCTCRAGWQGLGVPGIISNGRQCFDDNECALGRCGDRTICVNLPGTFRCDCQPGYRHSSTTVCVDIDECAINTHNCDNNARCINTDGSFICVCLPNYEGSGVAGDCREVGSCMCWGEPHCRSFDERILHFQGACSYTLARDGCINGSPSGTPTFEVIQKNWKKDRPESVVTWTKEIMVRVFGKVIILRQRMLVVLDGQQINLPANPVDASGAPIGLNIMYFEGNVLLTTKFGLYVKWNGDDRIEVKLEAPFKNQTCGLCGNFDNNAANDWILGSFCQPNGNVTDNARLFGDSWRTDGGMDSEECKPSCSFTPDPVCVGDPFERAKTECNKLKTIFATCAASMNAVNDSFDSYIESCIYDTCLGGINLCQTASTMASVCQSRYNTTVQWRSASFCPLTCGINMHYEVCAAPCQATCVQPNITALMTNGDCLGRCTEACVCNTGYVMTNGACVLPNQCGCQVSGLYYNVGNLRIKPNCTERCNCTVPGSTSLTCSPYQCHQYGFCGFEDDMYDCHCKTGFSGNGTVCIDDNECVIGQTANNGPCSPQATCANTIGSYTCTCNNGWQGDGTTCVDINECLTTPCNVTTQECFNTPGSYECRCLEGFVRNTTTNVCVDKNECNLNQHSCERSTTDCRNTFGGYECDCKPGYTRLDQYRCRDIDECAISSLNNCDQSYASCTNNAGSYSCSCRVGFTGNGSVCTDVNECLNPNVCYINATCNNTIGSFFCTCDTGNLGCTGPDPCLGVRCNGTQVYCYRGVCYCERGFVKNMTTGLCVDENECLTGNNNCTSTNALCLNTFGSYECQCLVGFVYNPITKVCVDFDECLENQNDCRSNSKCVNTVGGYQCQCENGFMGHCEECRDVDECEFSLHACDQQYATCNNTVGSFLCACNPGFEGNGKTCYDVNECTRGLANCPSKAACINSLGSFKCQCSVGYVMTLAGTCEDENECLSSNNDCSHFSKCINNVGSYTCECIPGYSGDGTQCTKDNTKLDCNGVQCHAQASCNNGSCVCYGGFEGDGVTCTDIDECIKYAGLCDSHAACYNTPGSYACQCNAGLSGDGKICYNETEIFTPCMRPGVCVNGICTDQPGGQHTCVCPSGYQLVNDACVDLNECDNSQICSTKSNSVCLNTLGSYICACSLGYQEQCSGSTCTCSSIAQCARNRYLCGANTRCLNTNGGYSCQCTHSGFAPVFGSQPLVCKAVLGTNGCGGRVCTPGSYCEYGVCICLRPIFTGIYTGGVYSCRPTQNPCQNITCPANSTCQGLNGGAGCVCDRGLHFSPSGVCIDIRECDNPLLNDCDLAHGSCVELIGGYKCTCSEGYQLDSTSGKCVSTQSACDCGPYGMCLRNDSCYCRAGYTEVGGRCTDIDECNTLQQPCHSLADCINTLSSYKCLCPPNYEGDGFNFCDLNECALGNTICASNANCTNTIGSYRCDCPSGYIGDGRTCVSGSNPCLFNNGGCGSIALCTWADNQVTCQCPSGYRGNALQCYDINECMEGSHNCDRDRAICTNNAGSFLCICKPGYVGNGVTCNDVDECATGKSNCHTNAKCTNTDGAFTCACNPGYRGDGVVTCVDVGDCRAKSLCDANARCVYTAEGYTCQCSSGFQGNGFDPCGDIDECALGTHQCVLYAECVNNPGSYTCRCTTGFVGDGRAFCNDINECLDPTSCSGHNLTVCANLPGGHSCPCAAGAQLNSGRCEDINECESATQNNCNTDATCTNTQGSYTCSCKAGFMGDGIDCQDIDECASGTSNCDGNAGCINTKGSFNCHCSAGLIGNGTTCGDADECDKTNPTHQCHELATCVNQNPGYECTCPPGYAGTGFFCAKTNPCNTPGVCNANATCVFDGEIQRCVCKSGYAGNGTVCNADNACTSGSPCDPLTSVCTPLDPVGFNCDCKPGFHKEGSICVDNDECNAASAFFVSGLCGDPLISTCVNSLGGYNCICTEHAIKSGAICIALDVCQKGGSAAGCHPHANCQFRSPGYSCSCRAGFEGDGKINCTDINECERGTHDCYGAATCTNLPGEFRCECPSGYVLASDPRTCEDINECVNDPFICGNYSRCANTLGGYSCTCVLGYAWNSATNLCEDVDECKTGTHPCHSLAACTNTPGSCTCRCGAGYTGDGIYFCEQTQNCPQDKSALCPNGTTCRDQGNGTYHCGCGTNQLDKGLASCDNTTGVCVHNCQTVDPCWTKASRCSPFAKCKIFEGDARCYCLDGFSGDGINCDDVNECTFPNQCDISISQCRNLDNRVNRLNYTCDCATGYENVLGTYQCVNINECDKGVDGCGANSRCVDTPGSYHCQCNTGFYALGPKECADIDECAQNTDDCNRPTAECVNLVGGFGCQCKLGLEMVNRTHCQDINECATTGVCGPDQTCNNVFASYSCSCPVGFTVSGVYCADVNECDKTGSCDATALCNNVKGSYNCYCGPGTRMSITGACENINECAEIANACPNGSLCVDSLTTGYTCICPKGYTNPPGNSSECVDINECDWGLHTCSGMGNLCFNTVGSFKCACQKGFALAGSVCVDVDECTRSAQINFTLCGVGTCANTPGSYICNCPQGYQFVNSGCDNIDECNLSPSSSNAANCKANEVCYDNPGAYRCYCPKGFTLDSNNSCVDIDECKSANACPNGVCTNTAGNYTCSCTSGFRPNGPLECVDIDECSQPNVCGDVDYGVCTNLRGSFNCDCKPGSAMVGLLCQQIDECVLANVTCPPNSHCVPTMSGHRCECNAGFQANEIGHCLNVDECGRGTHQCDPMANCADTIGSYTCACKPGYTGDGRTCRSVCDGACAPNQMCKVTELNTPQCTCECVGKRCLLQGQVCDSKGRTHASESAMYIFGCMSQETNLTVSYFSACKTNCTQITCPESHVCAVDSELNKPLCKCQACTDADRNSGPVCSSDLVQFSNKCDYIKYKCYWKDSVSLSNMTVCRQPIHCKVSEWSQWGGCSRTCGIGFQVRTRSLVRDAQFNGNCPFDMTTFAECYSGPCPDGPCSTAKCGPSEICVDVNNTAVCRCTNCYGRGDTNVCGLLGNQTNTFKNLCELEKQACLLNTTYSVFHQGPCGETPPSVPAICSLVYNFNKYRFPDGCESENLLPLHRCDGGCGNSTTKCCVPLHTRTMTARYQCLDNSLVIRAIVINVSCECKEKSHYISGKSGEQKASIGE